MKVIISPGSFSSVTSISAVCVSQAMQTLLMPSTVPAYHFRYAAPIVNAQHSRCGMTMRPRQHTGRSLARRCTELSTLLAAHRQKYSIKTQNRTHVGFVFGGRQAEGCEAGNTGHSHLGKGVASEQHQGKAGGVLSSQGQQELGAVLGASHSSQHSADAREVREPQLGMLWHIISSSLVS